MRYAGSFSDGGPPSLLVSFVLSIDDPLKLTQQSIAVPHAATEDNVYEGYFIPKGRLSWRMSIFLLIAYQYFQAQ